jgi:dihydroflavonol-4-reductase
VATVSDVGGQLPALVTGASGHVGANLVRALVGQGRKVRALAHEQSAGIDGLPVEIMRADVLDRPALDRACRGVGTVFHLAGKISAGWESAESVRAINVTGTDNVVAACLGAGVRRLVHMSSIQALSPRPGQAEIDESCALVAPEAPSRGAYDHAKAAAERLVLGAVERGLDAVVLNPTAVIGPFDFQPSPMGEVLLALARGKLPALVAGGGCDFVDARDVAQGSLAAERHGRCGQRYILTGTRMTLVELARRWALATGRPAPRLVVPMGLARLAAPFAPRWARWRGHRPLFTSESLRVLRTQPPTGRRKAEAELGYQTRPVEETLRDTCVWMKERGWL